MFTDTLKIIFFFYSIQTSSSNRVEDQMLIKFLAAFQVNGTVQTWMETKNKNGLRAIDLFQANLATVRDTLIVMDTKKYAAIKPLILATNMYFEVGYPYYETLNIISAVKQILMINDEQNKSKLQKYDMNNFNENVLFNEYSNMYKMLEMSIVHIGSIFNYEQTNSDYDRWTISRSI